LPVREAPALDHGRRSASHSRGGEVLKGDAMMGIFFDPMYLLIVVAIIAAVMFFVIHLRRKGEP
jgi:hypothetical protein